MILPVLALSIGAIAAPASAARPAMLAAAEGTVVYLGCQVAQMSLTDCKVANNQTVADSVATVAVNLAQTMTLPAGFAERNTGRVMIKLVVKP